MLTERLESPPLPTDSPSPVRLHGLWLWFARAAWVALVGATIVVILIGIRPGYQAIQNGIDEAAIVPHDVVLSGLAASGIPPLVFVAFNLGGMVLVLLVALACGLFIFWKRSDELLALLLSLAFISFATAAGPFLDSQTHLDPALRTVAGLLGGIGIMFLFPLLALFPDGRFRPRWSIAPAIVWIILVLIYLAAEFIWPIPDTSSEPSSPISDIIIIVLILSPLISFAAAAIYRYRKLSSPTQRQQTKLVVYAGVLLVAGYILDYIIGEATAGFWQTQRGSLLPALVEVLGLLALLPGLIGLPVAVVFAMQRYRLWDVDFLINRSLAAGGLTGLLAVVFTAAFFALNAALAALLGPGQTVLAAVAATLILAILFDPARRRMIRFVDRRFYGIRLDYAEAGRPPVAKPAPDGTTTSFGEYTGLTLLGRGGMGEVYRGQHPTLGRSVAIKILPGRSVPDEKARQRFLREAQLIARLKHPNIVSIYDFGEQDGIPYMIMEYIEGPDLGSLIKTRGRLPLGEALPLLADIASALDFIHQNGVVHRDVKPSNILVEQVSTLGSNRTHRAVLTDFGIARMMESASHLTQGGMVGTLDYISPEQIQGASRVDSRADVYSFGVLAYHVLTGELPFQRNSPGAMVLAHMMQPPPDPRVRNPELPDRAADAVLRAMNKHPGQRFGTAGEFAQAMG